MSCSDAIAQAVLLQFERGFVLDDRAVHFVDSTFMTPTADDIRRMLETDCDEREILLGVAVVPDDRLRLDIEAALDVSPEGRVDEGDLFRHLPERIETAVIFPDARGRIPFFATRLAVERVVSQLNVSSVVNREIRKAVCDKMGASSDLRLAALSMVRNRRVPESKEATRFVTDFVRVARADDGEAFLARLALVLELAQRSPQDDMFDVLAVEKAACLRALRRSALSQRRLEKDNVETVMLGGNRGLLCVDREELLRRVGELDAIALSVFGRIPLVDCGGEDAVCISFG